MKMTEVLRNRINSRSINRANVETTTAGYDYMGTIQKGRDSNGRQLDLTLVPYTQQLLQQAKGAGQSYQYAVVLAGINDLGAGNYSAAAVFPKLVQMYDMLLASGATVIAVAPWPNRFVSRSSDNERQRQLLQQMMQDYVSSPANSKRTPRVYLMQLPREWFDFWTMPASRVAIMQDDLLHLTPYGYDMFGQLVAESILSHIHPTECLCPCSNGAASRTSSSSGVGGGGMRGLGQMLANWRVPFMRRNGP